MGDSGLARVVTSAFAFSVLAAATSCQGGSEQADHQIPIYSRLPDSICSGIPIADYAQTHDVSVAKKPTPGPRSNVVLYCRFSVDTQGPRAAVDKRPYDVPGRVFFQLTMTISPPETALSSPEPSRWTREHKPVNQGDQTFSEQEGWWDYGVVAPLIDWPSNGIATVEFNAEHGNLRVLSFARAFTYDDESTPKVAQALLTDVITGLPAQLPEPEPTPASELD